MNLLTQALIRSLPPIGATNNEADPIVRVKFFDPTGSWNWYAVEYDGEDEFLGMVHGHAKELGYFSLRELQAYRGRLGLGIERDLYFVPCPLSAMP